jgi:hypothetical protein
MTFQLTKTLRRPAQIAALLVAATAGGCANDGGAGGMFTTGSLTEQASLTKTSVDPACSTLASQIEALRKEGTVDRLEKAAAGKTSTVNVQRASLTKQTQLNKANADYIAKCGPNPQKATVAAIAAPAAPTAATVTKAVAVAKETGVTVAAPSMPAAAAAVAKPQ